MSAQRITPRKAGAPRTSRTSTGRTPLPTKAQAPRHAGPYAAADKRTPAAQNTRGLFRKPSPKQVVIGVLIVLVAAAALGLFVDTTSNFGKIHKGVVLQGVALGGMTREEAAAQIDKQIGTLLSDEPVDLFADDEALAQGADDYTVELDHVSTTYQASQDIEDASSWRISTVTVGATIDSAQLAQEAYKVGRGKDFFAGRIKATLFGVELSAQLSYEPSQLAALEDLLSDALGFPMQNADISFEDGSFVVISGAPGKGVDHTAFTNLLDQAFLGALRNLVVPICVIPVDITDEQAAALAQKVEAAISQPIAIVYSNEDSWNLDSYSLGSWISTSVFGSGVGAQLIAQVAEGPLAEGVREIIGNRDPGIRPQNARFEAQGNGVVVIPSVKGTGINYNKVAADINAILFPAKDPVRDRRVQLTVTDLEPSLSTEAAQAMHITDLIGTYTTEYLYSSDAKITNIHLASDLINNSLIEPGGVWSFNDTAGECTAERGFQEAKSIIEGEYVDEIGGGICQVATTVFNAVLESGLPVVERVNHSFYLLAYPAGRDATVSWKWPDLKFENETGNWMLLTMSYDDETVTCNLWGTSLGYRVEFEDTGFFDRTDFITKKIDDPELEKGQENIKQEGVRGRSIVVTRYVYNAQGELIHKTDFKSVYDPETEIIEVGTKEVPKPAGETPGGAGGADGAGAGGAGAGGAGAGAEDPAGGAGGT